jgi:hypothetical protein
MVKVSSPALIEGAVYVPGLPKEYVADRFGIPLDDIAKLGSAENPHGPSLKAVEAGWFQVADRTSSSRRSSITDIEGLGNRYLRVDLNLKKHMLRFLSALRTIDRPDLAN